VTRLSKARHLYDSYLEYRHGVEESRGNFRLLLQVKGTGVSCCEVR